jgi:hypothetical protein
MRELEKLMIENQDVLQRLKEGDPNNYTAEKFLKSMNKREENKNDNSKENLV